LKIHKSLIINILIGKSFSTSVRILPTASGVIRLKFRINDAIV